MVGNGIFQTVYLEKEGSNTNQEMTLQDSQEMNYDSKLQNMSWFCYKPMNMLSKTSMIT